MKTKTILRLTFGFPVWVAVMVVGPIVSFYEWILEEEPRIWRDVTRINRIYWRGGQKP